jgi:hypothetical protein
MLNAPVEPLFQILERASMIEPRIERAMNKDAIWLPGTERRMTHSDSWETPQSVHDYPVKAAGILMKPMPETR